MKKHAEPPISDPFKCYFRVLPLHGRDGFCSRRLPRAAMQSGPAALSLANFPLARRNPGNRRAEAVESLRMIELDRCPRLFFLCRMRKSNNNNPDCMAAGTIVSCRPATNAEGWGNVISQPASSHSANLRNT
jgi:hypothetical protein